MGTRAPHEQARHSALRDAFRDAFQQFSSQVRLLQSLLSDPASEREAIEEARRRVAQAQRSYRESRNLLAQFMLSGGEASAAAVIRHAPAHTAASDNKPPRDGRGFNQRSQVERLAYQLWEEAGRPSGRADEHWYLAERLVQISP